AQGAAAARSRQMDSHRRPRRRDPRHRQRGSRRRSLGHDHRGNRTGTGPRRGALAVWIAGIVLAIGIIARTSIGTDMSAFLPRSPTPAQQVLVDQVQNGAVSRLILLAVEGAPPETLAALSKALAARLRPKPAFALVGNGEEVGLEAERDF